MKEPGKPRKVVDETTQVRCALGQGTIREEVWQYSRGAIAKYNLTFINQSLYAHDNGRVLGYDNNHAQHHRHYAGTETKFTFVSYEKLMKRFLREVHVLREKKEPICR